MIGLIHGRIASKAPPQLIVDVGGVGYEIEAPMSTFFLLPAIGQEVRLLTHMVVREDAQLLYGFATEEERRLFRNLLKVSGVGPKIGLALLSGISVEGFAHCVRNKDVACAHARTRHRPQDRGAIVGRDERPPEWHGSRRRGPPQYRQAPALRTRHSARSWRSVTGRPRPRACSRASRAVHSPLKS